MSYSSISHSNPIHATEEISLHRPINDNTAQHKTKPTILTGNKFDPMLDNYTKYQQFMQENPNMLNSSCYHPLQSPADDVIPLDELPVKKLIGRPFPQLKRQWMFQTDEEIHKFDVLHFKVLFLVWLPIFALYYYFRWVKVYYKNIFGVICNVLCRVVLLKVIIILVFLLHPHIVILHGIIVLHFGCQVEPQITGILKWILHQHWHSTTHSKGDGGWQGGGSGELGQEFEGQGQGDRLSHQNLDCVGLYKFTVKLW